VFGEQRGERGKEFITWEAVRFGTFDMRRSNGMVRFRRERERDRERERERGENYGEGEVRTGQAW
jgi:hypothetical protein